jgi:3-oxoacyl-[acyl-carrier-protein] synthase II
MWGEIIGCGAAMVGPTGNRGRQAGREGTADVPRDYLRQAVRLALKAGLASAAGRLPSTWHLHAHGYSSPAVDASEGLAIGDVLAEGKFEATPVVSAKSLFGNLGAGSAAVELICSLLAIEKQQLFAIKNLKKQASYAPWRAAQAGWAAGQAVVHSSFTLQGQASTIVVAAS